MHESALNKLDRLYRDLDAELSGLDVECAACGACCDFPNAGHILYASGLEIGYFLREIRRERLKPLACGPELCPF